MFTGEAREVHQICVLVGYGADAICPYMVFEIAQMLREENVIDVNDQTAYENYAAAVDRGISKVRIQIFMGKPRYFRFEITQMLKEEIVIYINGETAYKNYAAAVDRRISKVRI